MARGDDEIDGGTVPLASWKGSLDLNEHGRYQKNTTNLMLYLQHLPFFGKKLRYNELADNVEWQGRAFADTDYVDIRVLLEKGRLPFDRKELAECVSRAARFHSFNPVTAYLNGLRWDGKDRLDRWLVEGLGAADIPIIRSFGRMFMVSAVARALDPGCQVDTVLILEGEQGIRKSSAISVLFGEEYVHHGLTVFKGQEAGLSLQGRWAIDLGELAGFEKREMRTIKDFLTRRTDNYRPVYGRHVTDRPRRVVFIGQTNETDYLDDPTGGRRFWPVACRSVNIPFLARNRDQLWAEALHRYRAKEPWWIEKGSDLDRLATYEQRSRYRQDVWALDIEKYLDSDEVHKKGCVLVKDILNALGFKSDRRDASGEMRVAGHLRFLQWTRARRRVEGNNAQWWFPPVVVEKNEKDAP